MKRLLCLGFTLLLFTVAVGRAEEDETLDPLPEEGMPEVSPTELSKAINEVASFVPAASAPPASENDTLRSLRHGVRQADLRAAVDAQDAAAVAKALDRLLAAGESEPGPRAQRRKGRLLELAKEGKWGKAQALVSTMIRDRRRHYQGGHGADQGTLVVLGAWLRFAQLGGAARCNGSGDRPGAVVKPAMTGKLAERIGRLEAGTKSDPLAMRALEAHNKIAPLAATAGGVTKAAGCQIKDVAGNVLVGF